MYMVLFATSVFILMGFIYWATAGYMSSQTDETIEAEIVGLAEQYQRQGLNGLISVIRERVARDPNGKAIYLFTARDFIKLAGNIDKWPEEGEVQEGWLNFTLNEELGWHNELDRPARARVFIVPGGLRLLVGRDVNEFMAVKELVERAINLGMAITFMLAMIGGVMMSRSTARRVEIINQTSQKIMKGNLSLRIPDRGTNDDFDQLARNLNEMLDRIFQLMEGIKHVSDNIAHDLRTPLTRLRNKLENTLLKVENEVQRELVASAVAEADQLLATFNALLRIARLEMGGRTDNFKRFNLSNLLLDSAELYELVAEDKQQTLRIRVQKDIEIHGDKDLIFQTVSNLIDNAIKYTPNDGDISIELDLHDKLVRLSIADSGIGIPEEERSKVFDRFYRVAKSRSQPGNGLGLSLVQAVVELHQGEIKLSDNEPGLIVTLELPEIDIVEGNEIKNEQAGIEVSTPA
ncbi:HAMP domain-containing sensor histidine kinase [Oleiphilus sp. HI0067]|nr:HAMP domain-containing sensor histidine kinase [Oleiphilus sp. HI0067]